MGVQTCALPFSPPPPRGDPTGASARLMRDAFRSWGHRADVYALELDQDLVGDGRAYSDWREGVVRPAGPQHSAPPPPPPAPPPPAPSHRAEPPTHHNASPTLPTRS